MTIEIEVQNASSFIPVPSDLQFEHWAVAALPEQGDVELLIRLVDLEESRQMNARFSNRDKPTNVLSFPAGLPQEIDLPLLGDIIICAPLVAEEAQEQGKDPQAHWAHLTIHGTLHLLGYDHQTGKETAEMEALECRLLQSLGFPDPYQC
jgi:probable rRNA maturation factor